MRLEKIKKHLPQRHHVQNHKHLRFLGEHLHSPNLWHFNRRSVARATAIGLFCAFLPMPFEMIPAAIGAVLFRGNLPLSSLIHITFSSWLLYAVSSEICRIWHAWGGGS